MSRLSPEPISFHQPNLMAPAVIILGIRRKHHIQELHLAIKHLFQLLIIFISLTLFLFLLCGKSSSPHLKYCPSMVPYLIVLLQTFCDGVQPTDLLSKVFSKLMEELPPEGPRCVIALREANHFLSKFKCSFRYLLLGVDSPEVTQNLNICKTKDMVNQFK